MAHPDILPRQVKTQGQILFCIPIADYGMINKKVLITVVTVAKVSSPSLFLSALLCPAFSSFNKIHVSLLLLFSVLTKAIPAGKAQGLHLDVIAMAVGTEERRAPLFSFIGVYLFPVLPLCPMLNTATSCLLVTD